MDMALAWGPATVLVIVIGLDLIAPRLLVLPISVTPEWAVSSKQAM